MRAPPESPLGQQFPRGRRLRHAPEFRAVYRHGLRRNGPFWALLAARAANATVASRVGLTTPRRLGAAPLRNRIRRRLRALARRYWAQLPAGWDLVLQPRVPAARAPFAQMEAEWMECLRWLARRNAPTLGQNKT